MLRFGIPVLLILSLSCIIAGCGGGTWHDEEMRHGKNEDGGIHYFNE